MPDTIFALSSGGLPSGIAVIRVSGTHSADALTALTGIPVLHRTIVPASIRDRNGLVLDRGLVAFFKGPDSFSGEDCAELHLHGSKAVVAAVLDALGAMPSLRAAEAGEFTRRAFINGKLDLTAAEALGDLLEAETEVQRQLAVENADGRQRRLYDGWRHALIEARALVEAELDFSDEGDVGQGTARLARGLVAGLVDELTEHLAGFQKAEIIRDGFRVVLIGLPNVGKSSLLNALANREVAIVTAVPGTTRDLIEVTLNLGGNKVHVTDTAGIRQTSDDVERIGVERARTAASRAHLVLHLHEGHDDPSPLVFADDVVKVRTKADLFPPSPGRGTSVSSLTGEGIGALLDEIGRRAAVATATGGRALPTRERHRHLLTDAVDELHSAVASLDDDLTIAAERLRRASDALGRLTGAVDVEDVLGTIFSRFCIGK